MSKYLERAKELRAIVVPHYNCAQSVFLPFAEGTGLSEEQVMAIASNFGAGMKVASVCGAITGGLMALGLYGVNDGPAIHEYFRKLKENHQGCVDCADLLRINKEQGGEKKVHCDEMVYECVNLVEAILKEAGKIQ